MAVTLVVARASGDSVRIVSDLRVTDAHDIRRGYPFGILKVVTLGPRLCVALAGPVDPGLDALRAIASEAASFDEVLLGLAGRSARPDGPEFLIVGSAPSRIARVRAGVIEDAMTIGWIGDIDAFNEFQRLSAQVDQHPVAGLEPQHALAAQMMMAFNGLIGGAVASVGEARVAVASFPDRQLHYQSGAVANPPPQSIPSGVPTPIRFGTAAEGGHAYSILTPTKPGPGAIGLMLVDEAQAPPHLVVSASDGAD